MDDAIKSFAEMLDVDYKVAKYFYEKANGDQEMAANMLFENEGKIPEAQPSSLLLNLGNLNPCEHWSSCTKLPQNTDKIYKEECMKCFDNWDMSNGNNVCLQCFWGFCSDHLQHHVETSNHYITMNIMRIEDVEHREKITKLAIGVEGGAQQKKYRYEYNIKCHKCNIELDKSNLFVQNISKMIIESQSAEDKEELTKWEAEKLKPCPHVDKFEQENNKVQDKNTAHCSNCEINENLWMCLTCGSLGCGRKQWGPTAPPGNNHAIEHYEKTGHPIVVKMGTITPDGKADIHCYACDNNPQYNYGDITDPKLSNHLSHLGIDINIQEKTVKSLSEMDLDINKSFLSFDSMNNNKTADGKELIPYYGSGFIGLINLGNSCYMNSVLQFLFTLPTFKEYYFDLYKNHLLTCSNNPFTCYLCQFCKLANGIYTDKYANYINNDGLRGIRPRAFKMYVGGNHEEFSTNRQQDALEYLDYLLTFMNNHDNKPNISDYFKYETTRRLECNSCHGIRYTSNNNEVLLISIPYEPTDRDNELIGKDVKIALEECIRYTFEENIVELDCPKCQKKTSFKTSTHFKTFPKRMVIALRRFGFFGGSWVPKKLQVIVEPPDELDLSSYYLKPSEIHNENVLPEIKTNTPINEELLNQIMDFGIERNVAINAIKILNVSDAEVIMNYIFEHMNELSQPTTTANNSSTSEVSIELVNTVREICPGLSDGVIKKALKECNNNCDEAIGWIYSHPEAEAEVFKEEKEKEKSKSIPVNDKIKPLEKPPHYTLSSVIAHRGTSVMCGHYVDMNRIDGKWYLYNDDNIVIHPSPPLGEGYIYIYSDE